MCVLFWILGSLERSASYHSFHLSLCQTCFLWLIAMDLGHRQLNDRIFHKSFLLVTPPSSSHIPALMWNKQEWLVAHRRSFAQGALCFWVTVCDCGFFVLLQRWIRVDFTFVRACPCLYGMCQGSHCRRKRRLCVCLQRQKMTLWQSVTSGDAVIWTTLTWSCRFD